MVGAQDKGGDLQTVKKWYMVKLEESTVADLDKIALALDSSRNHVIGMFLEERIGEIRKKRPEWFG